MKSRKLNLFIFTNVIIAEEMKGSNKMHFSRLLHINQICSHLCTLHTCISRLTNILWRLSIPDADLIILTFHLLEKCCWEQIFQMLFRTSNRDFQESDPDGHFWQPLFHNVSKIRTLSSLPIHWFSTWKGMNCYKQNNCKGITIVLFSLYKHSTIGMYT